MWVKWVFDRVMALVGLVVLSPLLAVVAILIAIKMPGGPVLFRQKRVGQYGELFTMVKFRSMTVAHGGSSISVAGESRITPLGAKLRKYKLDELPELWNVLIGDMSFVGPRPDVPGYADKLVGEDREILQLKPGITGPASLKYRNEEEILASVEDPIRYNDEVIFPDKVRINREYMEEWSFWGRYPDHIQDGAGVRRWRENEEWALKDLKGDDVSSSDQNDWGCLEVIGNFALLFGR